MLMHVLLIVHKEAFVEMGDVCAMTVIKPLTAP